MVNITGLSIVHTKSEKTKNEYNVLIAKYVNEDGEELEQNVTFDNSVLLVLADLSPTKFDKKLKNLGDEIVIFEKKDTTK